MAILGFGVAAGPVAAAGPGTAQHGVLPADLQPHAPGEVDLAGRLRGRLTRLVRAAEAGPVPAEAFRGLEVAQTTSSGADRGAGVGVSLSLDPTEGDAALAALLAQGARIANRRGDTVEAYLPEAALRTLATQPGIIHAEAIIRPVPMGSAGLGSIVGQGVALQHADQWQAAGFTGAGIKVGIIDGGFVGLTARIGTELPTSVQVRCYQEVGLYSIAAKSCENATPHGTAVAETIADMAPGISLYLADPISFLDLQSSVAWMTANGVQIINVSVGYGFEGPGDGTGPPNSVYSVVDQAVAGGALWVNAAGNAQEDGWTGTWTDADSNGALEFHGTDERDSLSLVAGHPIVVTLRWNDTWGTSGNDYNVFLYGSGGSTVLASSEDTQNGHGYPVETFSFVPASSGVYRIGVQRAAGSGPSVLQLLILTSDEAPLQYRTDSGTLPSPADSANAGMLSVGAVPFDAPDTIEPYSSRGPTTDSRVKPDLVAADCTLTSLLNPFCGTSQAAPYTSGAAALALGADPTLGPPQLATWLRSHAVPLGAPSPNSVFGWGRLDLGAPPQLSAPTALAFAAQPAAAIDGLALGPAPAVRIVDQNGRTVTSGPGSTATLTLALAPTGDGTALTCPAGFAVAAIAGVATFDGCSISPPTAAARLVATSSALTDATSAPFAVLPAGPAPAPALTITASAAAITLGGAATLRATISAAAGVPLAGVVGGRMVTFQQSADGITWQDIGTAASAGGGVATLRIKPTANRSYRAAFAGSPDLGQAASAVARVSVRETIRLRPTNSGRTLVIPRFRTISFALLVRPGVTSGRAGVVTVEAWRLVGSTWKRVISRSATLDSHGAAAISITFDRSGRWYVRSIAKATAVNAASAWSPLEQFRVL